MRSARTTFEGALVITKTPSFKVIVGINQRACIECTITGESVILDADHLLEVYDAVNKTLERLTEDG